MGPARDVNINDLEFHLLMDHGVATQGRKTKGELGKLHTLVHAVLAHPELGELMNLPEEYGTGRASKVKY